TARVSVSSLGGQGHRDSGFDYMASMSADGRYVAFSSYATDLVPGKTNGVGDVYMRDRETGQTSRVSVSSSGARSNNGSSYPSMSADGRCVAFASPSTNLVEDDTNGFWDVFVRQVD